MKVRVEATVWFSQRSLPMGATPLQRALGDRLRVPVERTVWPDGQQHYACTFLAHEGGLSEAGMLVEREVTRFLDQMDVRDGASMTMLVQKIEP